jgi:hypothetical protein
MSGALGRGTIPNVMMIACHGALYLFRSRPRSGRGQMIACSICRWMHKRGQSTDPEKWKEHCVGVVLHPQPTRFNHLQDTSKHCVARITKITAKIRRESRRKTEDSIV